MTAAEPEGEPAFSAQTFRQLAWRLSASSSIYTAGLIALRFSSLLLIPLYWRYLDPADYGILAAAAVVTNFVYVVLGLGVSESITRFYRAWPESERRERIGSLWMVDWGSSFAIGVPLAVWGAPLLHLAVRQVPFTPYLQLAIVSATLTSLSTGPLMLLRVQERAGLYISVTSLIFAVRTALAIYFVVFRSMGPLGVLEADVITGLLMLPVYVGVMLGSARPAWNRTALTEGLGYSLPLIPGIVAESVIFTMDRFVLDKYVTLAALGLYSVGDQLGSVVRIVSGGFKTAWLPFEMRVAAERPHDAPSVIGRAATYYVMATILLALAVAMTSADLIAVIGVPKYYPVAALVPLFVVPSMFLCLVPVALGGLGVAKRTGYASGVAGVQLAVGLAGLLLLVPRWGIYGALAALWVANGTRLILGLALAQRFYPVAFEWRKIGLLFAAALAAFVAGRAVPVVPSAAGFAARSAVLTLFAGAALWFVLGGRQWWSGHRWRPASAGR
ncbi:MAG: lipopolysaccharide biosynthesis protein [Acidobacteriota bacterium]